MLQSMGLQRVRHHLMTEQLQHPQIQCLFRYPDRRMGSLVAQAEKNPPAMWETWVQSLGQEDSLEKGTATHSSILAWRIPWTI